MTRANDSDDMDAQREELLGLILNRPRRTAEEKLRWLEEIKRRAAAQDEPPAAQPLCSPPPREGLLKHLSDVISWEQFLADGVDNDMWNAFTVAAAVQVKAYEYAKTVREKAEVHARTVRKEADEYAAAVRKEADEAAAAVMARAAEYEDQALEGAARTQRQARSEAQDMLAAAQAEADSLTAFAQQIQANWRSAANDRSSPDLPIRMTQAKHRIIMLDTCFALSNYDSTDDELEMWARAGEELTRHWASIWLIQAKWGDVVQDTDAADPRLPVTMRRSECQHALSMWHPQGPIENQYLLMLGSFAHCQPVKADSAADLAEIAGKEIVVLRSCLAAARPGAKEGVLQCEFIDGEVADQEAESAGHR